MSQFSLGSAYIDLALRGQQGVTAALAQMRQQFQQTTSAAQSFRNLLSAGPGTRLAGQQLQAQALRAQVEAAGHGAMARAMTAPAGRAALARQAQAESDTATGLLGQGLATAQARSGFAESAPGRQAAGARAALGAELQLAEARQKNAALTAQAAHAETPAGQKAQQEQYRLQGQAQAAALRHELADLRARSAYEATPGGRQAGRDLAGLREQRDALEESRRRKQVIDEYGQLGGRMLLFKEALGKAAPALGVATAAAGFLFAEHRRELDLAGHANPVGARHLETAREAVQIQTGRSFLPQQQEELARYLRLAEAMRNEPPTGLLAGLRRRLLGNPFNNGFGADEQGGMGLLRALFPGQAERKRDQDTLRRNGALEFQGPFASRFESFEQYGESLQMAGSNQTALQAQNLQDQLRAYVEANRDPDAGVIGALLGGGLAGILTRIARNTANLANFNPAWR